MTSRQVAVSRSPKLFQDGSFVNVLKDNQLLQRLLHDFFRDISKNLELLQKLIYKNRNQQRRSPVFHRLDHVRRLFRIVTDARRESCFKMCENFVKGFKLISPENLSTFDEVPSLAFIMEYLVNLDNFLHDLNFTVIATLVKAANFCVIEIRRENFVGFHVILLSVLSVLREIVALFCLKAEKTLFNLLMISHQWPDFKRLGGKFYQEKCSLLKQLRPHLGSSLKNDSPLNDVKVSDQGQKSSKKAIDSSLDLMEIVESSGEDDNLKTNNDKDAVKGKALFMQKSDFGLL